ncbi:MAG: NUDIX hydrolase [Bacteroidia bacterium]
MYKVYYNNRLIYIGADIQPFLEKKISKKLTGSYNIREEWEKFKNDETCKGIWMQGHVKGIWNKFKSLFVKVEAAGGLVCNPEGEYLLIFRKKKWDLPKGKLEKKETFEAAALREVEEECGISELSITEPLATSYHIYEEDGWYILKRSHWYAMSSTFAGPLVPQQEEGIEKVVWAKPNQMKNYMENMFPSVRDLLQEHLQVE